MAATDCDGASDTGLSDEELVDQVLTFFVAGTEPTASTVAFAARLLSGHGETERALHEEADRVLAGDAVAAEHLPRLDVARRVVAETLRLYPPGWLFTRAVVGDADLGGVRLPAGTTLAYSPYLIHRRPDLYDEPDRFDPQRWRGAPPERDAYLPFGSGARKCVGERFALTEAVLVLAAIAARWRLVPLPGRPPARTTTLTTTLSPTGLRMRLVARHPARRAIS
ncbi:cytochrome P450 [Streptomyces sp. G45]|uniref:cytochrome P450 n=1 Tax=Streptomyces sp. G45 TaxID=3406627 RepID=UPI003C1BFE3F